MRFIHFSESQKFLQNFAKIEMGGFNENTFISKRVTYLFGSRVGNH